MVFIIDSQVHLVVGCLCGSIKFRDLREDMGNMVQQTFLCGKYVTQVLVVRAWGNKNAFCESQGRVEVQEQAN